MIKNLCRMKRKALVWLAGDFNAQPARAFECCFVVAFLINMAHAFGCWQEWLTSAGIHPNAEEMAALRYPPPWPTLLDWQVVLFGFLVLLGSVIILFPRGGDGAVKNWLRSAMAQKLGFGLLFACGLYAQRVDYISATMVNRLFVVVFAMLALAPPIRYTSQYPCGVQSIATLRLLQATLLLQYFASGLAKMNAEWLASPEVLWSHVQGLHRTDFAAWALRTMPKWSWSVQQYLALAFEVLAPLLFGIRFLRSGALAFGFCFHLLIALLMQDLILYAVVMWSFYPLFLPASFWRPVCNELQAARHSFGPALKLLLASTFGVGWWRKLGGWQTDLLTRGYGLLLYLNLNCYLLKRTLPEFLAKFPASTLYLGLCGIALMLFGARVPLLALALGTALDFFLKVLYGEGGEGLHQQAAEYPLFMLVPAALLLTAFTVARCHPPSEKAKADMFDRLFEEKAILVFRCSAVCALFFVSFHKLNVDFFNPTTSCETAVKQFYAKNWTFGWLQTVSKYSVPWLVVAFEGLIPIVLLMTFRRLGILVVSFVFGIIAFVDALTITLCVIIPSLAFLSARDWRLIRRHWSSLLMIWFFLLCLWLPFSCGAYIGIRPWFQPALHQSIVLAVIVFVSGVLVLDLWQLRGRFEWSRACPRLGWQTWSLRCRRTPGFTVVFLTACFWLLNGFAPYLGLKFNYSFAMLSNLRVDDARWNHLLVPKWVRLTQHDGFFHVQKADLKFGSKNDEKSRGQVRLRPGLFSPQAFHDELRRLSKLPGSVEVALLLEHSGQAYDYQGSVKDLSFQLFLDRLPQPHGHWLHDYLPADGPMGCKH